ncbi:MAG: helix-turn-helix transcriptional regulator [Clostridia bacterium]|nr:helix-turn-helix transcriptional regulator [Clostridia bacterium]
MILADKIINERKKLGWSQEELAEKLDVSRQSVSKWESAQSIPDLTKILQLAEVFGVSTDYLLKDELEPTDNNIVYETGESSEKVTMVSMEQANEFMEGERKRAPRIALGTTLCILSPVTLIVLAGLQDTGILPITEGAAAGIGLALLFILVAAAVFIFITAGGRKEKYNFIETDNFETAYGVSGIVKAKKEEFHDKKTRYNAIGVVMCILAVLPLIIGGIMEVSDSILILLVGLMLVLIAAAVYMFININMIEDSYNMLLQESDYTKENKMANSKLVTFNATYWSLAVVIFFLIMYFNNRFDAWPVFLVAGVMYSPARMIVRNFIK